MGKVQKLPDDLANQIAAGEVVERPASVVKELLENALDAGASRVDVAVDDGGVARLRVTDDGEGMGEDDARLALQRHATSKIRHIDDLSTIGTFGFRGEALPSIASVARLTLRTRARGQREGLELRVEGGGPMSVRPAGGAEGTTVDVADLFFNVPARRKFLKATATESAHVGEAVLLAALARPEVTFVLTRDGRGAREYLRARTRAERVRQVIAEERLETCIGERGPLRIEGHLGPPERARAGATGLYVLVNGRPVKDRLLARAVAQAYGSVLEAGRYPVGALYLDLPPELVDVNVHPQKAEVRFADGRALFDAVTRELHGALARVFALPAGPLFRHPPPAFTHGAFPSRPPMPWPPSSLDPPGSPDPWALAPAPSTLAEETELPVVRAEGGLYGRLTFLAQVRGTYLMCEGPDGLYVLDQHAAAERVTFHRLRRAFASRTVAVQRLLLPEVIELSPAEAMALADQEAQVEALGVELRSVGPTAVAVHGLPKLLARATPERIVRDLAAELGRHGARPFGDAADLVLATMACHGSVRAGDVLAPDEARALLRDLDEVDFAGHCPHGRPVVTRISFAELEHRVGRG